MNEEKKAPQIEKPEPKEEISIDDFAKLDLRVAEVIEVEEHPNADKLLVLTLDLGYEKRQVVSGIKSHYNRENLMGKRVVVITNLKPVKLRGVESQGMILAAEDEENLSLLGADVVPGTPVS